MIISVNDALGKYVKITHNGVQVDLVQEVDTETGYFNQIVLREKLDPADNIINDSDPMYVLVRKEANFSNGDYELSLMDHTPAEFVSLFEQLQQVKNIN